LTRIAECTNPSACDLPERLANISIRDLAAISSRVRGRVADAIGPNATGQWKELANRLTSDKVEAAHSRNKIATKLVWLSSEEKLRHVCTSGQPFWKFPASIAIEALQTELTLDVELRDKLIALLPGGRGPWADLRRALKRTVAQHAA